MAQTKTVKPAPVKTQAPLPSAAVVARLRFLRMSPRKTRLIANFVTGMNVDKALEQLHFLHKAAKEPIVKLINSAVANAEHNFQLDKNNLFIAKFIVNQGPSLKRFKPKAHGRAGMIRRRTCHVELTLGERVPSGKLVKKAAESKDKPEDVKMVTLDEVKQAQKDQSAQAEGAGGQKTRGKGFTKKFFNRKTG